MDIHMTECIDCGAIHAERVSKCPECGYKTKRKRPAIFVIGMIFLGVMFIVPTMMPLFGYFAMSNQDEALDEFEKAARTQNGRFQVSAPNLAEYVKMRPEKLQQETVEIFGNVITVKEGNTQQLKFTFKGAETLTIICKQVDKILKVDEIKKELPTVLGGLFQTYQVEARTVWLNPCIVFQIEEK